MTATTNVPYVVQTAEAIAPYCLSIKNAARYADRSPKQIERWIEDGSLPYVRDGETGWRYVRVRDLEVRIDAQRVPPLRGEVRSYGDGDRAFWRDTDAAEQAREGDVDPADLMDAEGV